MAKMTFAGLAALLLAGGAAAQPINPRVGTPPGSPPVSPYINLLRGSSGPALNYYGLVRPQFQTNAGLQSLQQQVVLSQAAGLPAGGADDVFVTGHSAVFMNLGGYFQSATGGIRPNRAVGAAGGVGQAVPRLPRPGPR